METYIKNGRYYVRGERNDLAKYLKKHSLKKDYFGIAPTGEKMFIFVNNFDIEKENNIGNSANEINRS